MNGFFMPLLKLFVEVASLAMFTTYDAWDDGSLGPLIGFEWRIGQVKFVFHHLSRREAHRRNLRPGWVMETITPEEEQEWSDNDTESNYSNEDDD